MKSVECSVTMSLKRRSVHDDVFFSRSSPLIKRIAGHCRKWIYGREDIPGAKMSSNWQPVVVVNPKNVEKLRGKRWSTLNEMIIIIPLTTAWNFCYTAYTAHTACPPVAGVVSQLFRPGPFLFFPREREFRSTLRRRRRSLAGRGAGLCGGGWYVWPRGWMFGGSQPGQRGGALSRLQGWRIWKYRWAFSRAKKSSSNWATRDDALKL